MEIDRRSLVLAMAGLAGCSIQIGGNETSTPTATAEVFYEVSGEDVVDAGSFVDHEIDVDVPAVIDYEADVREGPAIDAFVLTRSEFRSYEAGEEFEPIEAATERDTSYADVVAELPAKDVNLVFDNTDAGGTAPPDDDAAATVSYRFTVRARE